MYSDVGNSNDGGEVNDVDGVVANGGYGNSKVDCCYDLDGCNDDNKDDGDVNNDDGGVDFSIGNHGNCGDGKSKVDISVDTAGL